MNTGSAQGSGRSGRLVGMRPSYELLSPTQRWTRLDGVWHRVWIARRADGALRQVAVRDTEAVAA